MSLRFITVAALAVSVLLLSSTQHTVTAQQPPSSSPTPLHKKTKPFWNVSLSTYDLPSFLVGGFVIAGQLNANDITIPLNSYVEVGYRPPGYGRPPFWYENFTTSLHVSGALSIVEWKKMIEEIIYTSGSATQFDATWFTMELYGFSTTEPYKIGAFPSPNRNWEQANDFCYSYSAIHGDPEKPMEKVSISMLSPDFISDGNLPEQWLGAYQNSDNSWSSITGPKIGQKIAHNDGSGCASCNWAPGQPNTTGAGNVVVADATGKWFSASEHVQRRMKSWCVEYPVHVYLRCNRDLLTDGKFCQFQKGPSVVLTSTIPPMTSSGGSTTQQPQQSASPPPVFTTTDASGTPPPEQSGTPPPDQSGTTAPDNSGTAPPDNSGTAPPDNSGTAPPDNSGTAPPDNSGTSPPDNSGTSPPDSSGTAPPDSSGNPPPPPTSSPPPTPPASSNPSPPPPNPTPPTPPTSPSAPPPNNSPPATTTASTNNNNSPGATPNTTSANGGDNSGAATEAPEETSPGARAGMIFGIGIAALIIVIAGLWFLRKKLGPQPMDTGENNKGSTSVQHFETEMQAADAELLQSMFSTL